MAASAAPGKSPAAARRRMSASSSSLERGSIRASWAPRTSTPSCFTSGRWGNQHLRGGVRHDVRVLRENSEPAAEARSGVSSADPMNGGLLRARDDGPTESGEEPTLEASGNITPDPFLAEVARIPARALPTTDPPLRAGEAIGHF